MFLSSNCVLILIHAMFLCMKYQPCTLLYLLLSLSLKLVLLSICSFLRGFNLLTNPRHLNLHVLTFINQRVLAKTCFVLTMMYSAAPKGTLALIRLSEQKHCLYSRSHTTPSPIDGNERRLREPVSNEATCSPARPSKNGFTKYPGNKGGSGFCFAVIFHPVQKMNIYESRKVMPKREMHSAGRLSDSWPMPEESGRQINKSRPRGCDRVTKNWRRAAQACACCSLHQAVGAVVFHPTHQLSSGNRPYPDRKSVV